MRSKGLLQMILVLSLLTVFPGLCHAFTYTVDITAGDIKSFITDPLSNSEHVWGIWALVAYPNLADYSITSLFTDQAYWYTTHDSEFVDAHGACFRAVPGAELPPNPARPLYMISDQPDPLSNHIMSYFGDTTTNIANSTLFGFTFDTTSVWDGCWHFLLDGSRYDKQANGPATWDEDFWGGKDNGEAFWDTRDAGGGLPGNIYGYEVCPPPVPEPSSLWMLGTGLLGLIGYGKRFGKRS